MNNNNQEQVVLEVEQIISNHVHSKLKSQIEAACAKHDAEADLILLQSLAVIAMKAANSLRQKGKHAGIFMEGGQHFLVLAEKNMLTSEHSQVVEGGEVILAKTAEALGFHQPTFVPTESEQEPSINEKLVQEVLAEEAAKAE